MKDELRRNSGGRRQHILCHPACSALRRVRAIPLIRHPLSFILLLLLMSSAAAHAAECIPAEKWRQALIAGDAAAVEKLIADGQKACNCASDQDNCLRFPSYSQLTSAAAWREASKRLLDWRTETFAQCGPLPQTTPAEEQAKRKCFETRADAISEGLGGEAFGRALAPIPRTMIDKAVANLDPGKPIGSSKKEKEYTEEEKILGRQICSLITDLEDATDKIDHVKRRKESSPDKDRRLKELETEIHDLTEAIVIQKNRFAGLAGESWSPFPFCKPPEPEKKQE
jgi:hypothetical protein